MRVSQAYPSKYLSAPDLQNREHTLTISRTVMEDIGQNEHKPIVFFQGANKGLVLNKTNANNIAAIYGDETDSWTGKQITLFTAWVDFQGRSVEAIRVRPVNATAFGADDPLGTALPTDPPLPAGAPPSVAQEQHLDIEVLDGDEIPF